MRYIPRENGASLILLKTGIFTSNPKKRYPYLSLKTFELLDDSAIFNFFREKIIFFALFPLIAGKVVRNRSAQGHQFQRNRRQIMLSGYCLSYGLI
jgi:hypothetical protein